MESTDSPTLASTQRSSSNTINNLHPKSDLVLVVGDKEKQNQRRFGVNTAVLVAVSHYFEVLLTSGFKEAIEIQEGMRSEVVLKEDEPEAMEVLLSALHYDKHDRFDVLDLRMLALVAIHSKKYQCNMALRPWVSMWFTNAREAVDAQDHGLAITAAYHFDSPNSFEKVTSKAVFELRPNYQEDWSSDELICLLPRKTIGLDNQPTVVKDGADTITDKVDSAIRKIKGHIRTEVETVERNLRDTSMIHFLEEYFCPECGKPYWYDSGKCQACRNVDLIRAFCTGHRRVAAYFELLRKSFLFPSEDPYNTASAKDLVKAYAIATTDYNCNNNSECPLPKELRRLIGELGRISDRIQVHFTDLDIDTY